MSDDDGRDEQQELADDAQVYEPGDPTGNATRADLRKQKRTQRDMQKQGDEFWLRVLADEVGRREIWGLLSELHPFETQYGAGPSGFTDPHLTFFKLGQQQWGMGWFLKLQQRDPNGVALMLQEHDPRFSRKR